MTVTVKDDTIKSLHVMPSKWDFYKLDTRERKSIIGCPFTVASGDHILYFPVDLHPNEFNYHHSQGLIFVTPIFNNAGAVNWFRVGVCSPDDLDLDLDFNSPQSPEHRRAAIRYLSIPTNVTDVFYSNVLNEIQQLTGAGILSKPSPYRLR